MSTKKIRPCLEPGCALPARPGLRRCGWHWLLKQPIGVQVRAADARLARAQERPGFEHRARVPQAQWPAGGRWCSGCQWFVPLFYVRGTRCAACSSSASHSAAVEKAYGISGAEYARLLALQGGRCAICRQKPGKKRLAVDHDHQTGLVRGLCCKRCNHDLLGAAHDSIEILQAAVRYLTTPPATGGWTPPEPSRPVRDDGPPPF